MEQQITLLLMYTYSRNHHVRLEASSQMMKKKQSPVNLRFKPAESCKVQIADAKLAFQR